MNFNLIKLYFIVTYNIDMLIQLSRIIYFGQLNKANALSRKKMTMIEESGYFKQARIKGDKPYESVHWQTI